MNLGGIDAVEHTVEFGVGEFGVGGFVEVGLGSGEVAGRGDTAG